VIYREVIRPPLRVLAFIYFLLFSLVIAIWASLGSMATQIAFIASGLGLLYSAIALTGRIEIDHEQVRVQRAHIKRIYIGKVTSLCADEMRLLRTRDADPAAFLALKFWEPRGVRIEILDPRDPTPYWLVTSKRGDEIAALLNEGKI
jgi:hypothetical protein